MPDQAVPTNHVYAATAERLQLITELSSVPPGHRTHYIGGVFVDTSAERVDPVTNPATGNVLVDVASGDTLDVDRAVRAASNALTGWRARPPVERAGCLLALADVLEQHAEGLARLESLQVGKPLSVSRSEVPQAADALRFFAGAARTTQTPAADQYVSGQLSVMRREPVGVVGAITPWNYPLLMAVWKIAPALAAGNTVVLKPSELTPLTTLRLAELASDTLPPGAFNVVLGTGPRVGQAIAAHPDIAMVSITGSVATGTAVARTAAETVKRVHLELGGKAPVIVFPDADLDAAANAIATMGFWNSGQECGSATRVLAHTAVHDQLIDRVLHMVAALIVGDPDEGDHIDIGPLITAAHRDKVAGFVDRALDDGAELLHGGGLPHRDGWFYNPTVIDRVGEGSELEQVEVFGPVVGVQTFTDEADAVRLANATRYGLAASVWTRDAARSLRLPDALDFGTVWVNSHLTLAAEAPWTGFGYSGYGRDMSTYALDDHTRTKHVMVATS